MALKELMKARIFADKPIDSWQAFIEATAENAGDDLRRLKVAAQRSLTVDNMAAYILAYDNTPEAKHAFKESFIGPVSMKDDAGRVMKDEAGNILYQTDENGEFVKMQSLIFAKTYFIDKYIPFLKVEQKEKKAAFDIIKDW